MISAVVKKSQELKDSIVKHLYYNQSISLSELSKLCGKSIPLINSEINALIEDGLVVEQGLAQSTGGRRPQVFLLNGDFNKYIIGVSIDRYVMKLVLYDFLRRKRSPVFRKEINLIACNADDVSVFVKSCLENEAINNNQIIGIGIGMPGFVNPKLGTSESFLTQTDHKSLTRYLTEALKMPVYIDNDSTLIAMAEINFGLAKGKKDVLAINIGWGTGLGLIINGQLYRGSTGYAGEFSHIPLASHNELCSCGKRGCIEVDTSLLVLASKFNEQIEDSGNKAKISENDLLNRFFKAIQMGDSLALAVLAEGAYMLGKGLSTLIHILNPELIVISGMGAKVGEFALPPIQQAINEFCIPRIAKQTVVKISEIYEEAPLLAAASLAINHLSLEK